MVLDVGEPIVQEKSHHVDDVVALVLAWGEDRNADFWNRRSTTANMEKPKDFPIRLVVMILMNCFVSSTERLNFSKIVGSYSSYILDP